MSRSANQLPDEAVQRLGRLDGLRGIAACVVAFGYHAGYLFVPDATAGFGPLTDWTLHWGWTCVDLFFVISGYIFAHVYLRPGALDDGRALREFALARVARLYPLHLLALLLVALAFWGRPENSAAAFGLHLVMMQAFAEPVAHTFVGPSWSLSIEVLCYVVFALSAVFWRRAMRPLSWALMLGGAAWLFLLGPPGGPWSGDIFARGFFGFFLGQLLWHGREHLAALSTPLLIAMLAAGLALDAGSISPLLPLGLLAWPAALGLALRWSLMESQPMLWLGDRSYAIYLIHMPLVEGMNAGLGKLDVGPATVLLVFAGFVVTVLALSDLTLRLVEKPARRWIRGWAGSVRAAKAAVAA
ncbi:acyltransferase [Novosphingobium sp. MW5]|nr:acyltransferase [Novosphingobium sp. MW5]